METTEGGLQGGTWKTSCSSLTRVILVETTEGGLQGGTWKTSCSSLTRVLLVETTEGELQEDRLTDDGGYNGRHIVAVIPFS